MLLRMAGLGGLLMLAGIWIRILGGPSGSPDLPASPLPPRAHPQDEQKCLTCHTLPDLLRPLPSGEIWPLVVDERAYERAIHRQKGYTCFDCHPGITDFPHPERAFQSVREARVQMEAVCRDCHEEEAQEYEQGLHAQALREGRLEAAVCTDCHGAHETRTFDGQRARIAETCRKCHSEIYDVYRNSVHGAALLEEGNPDVPACTDCHDYHRNAGPTREGFHLFSPQLCAKCHTDEQLMARYGVRTGVFNTYVADFHGATVTIFEKIAPDQPVNKPVCVDCHGVHNILPPTDENSTVMKANLINTCRRCHPEADLNFPDAWMSHYEPDPQRTPVVFAVQWFYNILIPTTVIGMLLFVSTDAWRRWGRRRRP